MVVIGTFAWFTQTITLCSPIYALVIILVTVITVLEDEAVAVAVGVIINVSYLLGSLLGN